VDARGSPERVLQAHPPDQRPQLGSERRSSRARARLPSPVPAKSRPVPPQEGLRTHDDDGFQDRGKPPIQLDKEQAIAIREPDPFAHLTPQDNQLLSKRRVLRLKPAPRLERRGQLSQDETEQSEHRAQVRRFCRRSTRMIFRYTQRSDPIPVETGGKAPRGYLNQRDANNKSVLSGYAFNSQARFQIP
jgi:hypothetical protein